MLDAAARARLLATLDLCRSLDDVLLAAMAPLIERFSFTGGSIALVRGEALVITAASGPFAAQAIGQSVLLSRSRAWAALKMGAPFLSNDVQGDNLRSTSPRVRSFLAAPLGPPGAPFGLLEVDSTLPHAFPPDAVSLVMQVAEVAYPRVLDFSGSRP
ncbi:MAG TPA: GAF domain-containing protein [Deinococcales bacterium]|nr:GAF domain-containing protein [Deinococcales bacterium]